jgi:putative transcription factor
MKTMDSYECEICGKKTKTPTVPTKVESAVFKVCPDCIKLGTPIETYRAPVVKTAVTGTKKPAAPTRSAPVRQRNYFAGLENTLVENYDAVIKKARESKGMTPEDLALKIKEKAMLIKKIERKEIHPEESVIKKLEKELNIKLTETFEAGETQKSSKPSEATLGDIVFMKKK